MIDALHLVPPSVLIYGRASGSAYLIKFFLQGFQLRFKVLNLSVEALLHGTHGLLELSAFDIPRNTFCWR